MKIFLFILLLLTGNQQSFKTRLDAYLGEQLRNYSAFKYEIVSLPQSDKEVIIDNERNMKITGNMGYVPVFIVNEKNEKTQSVVSLRLKLYKSAAVAVNSIKRGSQLSASDIDFRITDVSQIRGSLLEDTSGISDWRAKNNIDKDEIVISDMLERMPLIKRGDNITACVVKGSVRIDVDAIARQDGSKDEIINIVTSDRKNFKARVIDRFSAIIIE